MRLRRRATWEVKVLSPVEKPATGLVAKGEVSPDRRIAVKEAVAINTAGPRPTLPAMDSSACLKPIARTDSLTVRPHRPESRIREIRQSGSGGRGNLPLTSSAARSFRRARLRRESKSALERFVQGREELV